MIIRSYPWKLDVDVEKTKKLYEDHDFSVNDDINANLEVWMQSFYLQFIESTGVDINRMHVSRLSMDDIGECLDVIFIVCGKFLAIPVDQYLEYGGNEYLAPGIRKSGVVVVNTSMDIDFMGPPKFSEMGSDICFKHPWITFPDEPRYGSWNCGYVMGELLIPESYGL